MATCVSLIRREPALYAQLAAASFPLLAMGSVAYFFTSGMSMLIFSDWSEYICLLSPTLATVFTLALAALARMLGLFVVRLEHESLGNG